MKQIGTIDLLDLYGRREGGLNPWTLLKKRVSIVHFPTTASYAPGLRWPIQKNG
jgi:hypothetical protein